MQIVVNKRTGNKIKVIKEYRNFIKGYLLDDNNMIAQTRAGYTNKHRVYDHVVIVRKINITSNKPLEL
jgi:ribosomal protein L7/L12